MEKKFITSTNSNKQYDFYKYQEVYKNKIKNK